MTTTERAIWQLERHLDRPLTLTGLARHCAVSPYHLVRSFRAATGLTPMTYLRARRLTLAATMLARGDDILSVALEVQYGSHEAFTRAFATCFGTTPTRVRQARSTQSLSLMEPLKMNREMIVDLPAPQLASRPASKAIGLSGRFSLTDLSGVPALWQQYAALIPPSAPRTTTMGISYDFDDAGGFSYLAGAEDWRESTPPDELVEVSIPAGRYAGFTHTGHISDLAKTYYTIFNAALEDHGLTLRSAPELEIYETSFDPQTGRGPVQLWIPID